jgi:thiol-disulfide isomerase/thioredoxin
VLAWLRKYAILIGEAALVVAAFLAISAYQARNLLDTDRQAAPELVAETLQGESFNLAERAQKPTLIYFFAPWCHICAASSDNIRRLRRMRNEDHLSIIMVGLDWQNVDEIRDYALRHDLNVPVLIGDAKIAADWQVFGFPTYYVLDDQHRVVSRDFGYSTQLGLWWRSWLPVGAASSRD